MEPYFMCQNCGEKTSTNFSYCRKCGAELSSVEKTPQSAQETDLPYSMPEKAAIDSIQLPASERIEVSHIEDEREIVTELKQLRDSPLAGRIIALGSLVRDITL
ncbi:MAG: zinc ribbon domain-containing protein [Candidatus Heimdallarchaeota archaeon]|nr:MAG: zinc ribbon domain-containing protein [Candidatus Heimdallarchaeota archaeon]